MRWGQGIMARIVLVGVLVLLALTLAATAGAQDSRKEYSLRVDKQPLTRALEQLYAQTGVFYGYSPDSKEEEQMLVGPVTGTYTIEQALTKLLAPTGLKFIWTNSRTISIVRPPPPPPKPLPPPQAKAPRTVHRERSAVPLPESMGKTIEEVIASASSIQRPFNVAAPVLVLDREYIEHTGANTVSELLRYLSQQSFLRPDAFRSNGAQYVELRGLGPDTTLVLINGRRAFASAASFTANAFDVNQLPLSAVDRVEVQLDSVSVSHGADAIGGVINVVLRDDIVHPKVQVQYGSADGGGKQRGASISAGHKSDAFTAAVILDYRDVDPLLGVERDLWSNQDYRRYGSIDRRTTISSPGNVRALLPGNLPGLNAPFAAIPERTAGPVTQRDEFRSGDFNYESLFQYIPIVVDDNRASAVANVQASVAPDLVASADLMAVDRRVVFQTTPPLVAGAIVPATNPYNAFQQPVIVTALLDGIDPTQASVDSLLIRGAASLRGKAKTWSWELSLLRSEEDAESRFDNVLDSARLAQVLADPDPARTVNLLAPGPAASPELLATLLGPTDIDTFATDATQLSGWVSGRLFGLPGGDVSAVLGTEWRKESVQFDAVLGSFQREVGAAFTELHLPVVSQAMHVPAMRELAVTVAGRYDRYSDFGDIFDPQYGLIWKPLDGLAFRATYGRSFRPPSMYDLYLPAVPLPSLVFDPRRNRELANVLLITGGSRQLGATHGESFTAGLEFSPEAIAPLKLSATYWRVTMDQRVMALPIEFALTHDSVIPGRVVRADPTPADVAAGLPGRLLQLDVSRMNFGSLATSGIDVGASYQFDNQAGHFTLDTKATWIDEYETLDLPGMAATDRVNIANSLGTIAKWRAVASVDWQRNSLGATAYLRYIPAYDDTLNDVRNGRTIASQTFLDLQLSLDIDKLTDGALLCRGLELAVGASNVFDQQPHFAEVDGLQGYDTSQGDLKGRFWYLRLGKAF
jgi:iron complex outermembrane recepter protein